VYRAWWGEELLGNGADSGIWATGRTDVTLGRLRAEVSWLATVLGHQGVRAGSTVALRGMPSFTQLWAVFACWSLGAQVIMLERRIDSSELDSLLTTCAPQFLVTFGDTHLSRHLFVDECAVLVRRLRGGRPASTPHCLVQFSSGTTGRMKAIGRTPESLLNELTRLRDLDGMPGPDERLLLLDSVTGSFGLIDGVLRGLEVGHGLLFATDARPAAMRSVAAGADVIIGAPRHFGLLSSTDGPATPRRLRAAISGGDVLSANVFDRFTEQFRVRIGQAYGTTETGLIAAELTGGHPSPHVGRPVPGTRTRIVGGVLEIHVAQSPYPYDNTLVNGGWLSTHDLMTQDPVTGMLRLRGRFVPTDTVDAVDVDLLGIEAVLRTHDKITAAVVVGGDRQIEAYVAGPAELGQVELTAWCGRFLRPGDIPTRYHVLPELPTTANGKYLRNRERLFASCGS
jgi:acyl-coenzyme A synthetase/AMP-(fatty) acid ligase